VSKARAMKQSAAAAGRRRKIVALLNSLPEARAVRAGDRHLSLEVRGKRFGCFLHDHHGDGRVALNLKAPRGAGQRLAAKAPSRFHVPKYIGHHGWVGVWLNSPAPDWDQIKELLGEAYYLTAPKRLANILQSQTNETEL
jgi:predicted DNA-binding protein (MmcQ/YjbR family)